MRNPSMSVTLAGVELKNPVVVASGTFGFGREYGQFYDLSELGAICVKGLTAAPPGGQPSPPHRGDSHGNSQQCGAAKPRCGCFYPD